MTCPECKSNQAISKAEAYDLLVELQAARQELSQLRRIKEQALCMFADERTPHSDPGEVFQMVPRSVYNALEKALSS